MDILVLCNMSMSCYLSPNHVSTKTGEVHNQICVDADYVFVLLSEANVEAKNEGKGENG